MSPCLICGSSDYSEYVFAPYVTCNNCSHTYQPNLPPKTWMNPEEGDNNGYVGAKMDDHEKGVNTFLANWLYNRYRPESMLDVGSGYPYLASRFAVRGVNAYAIDGSFKESAVNVDGIYDVRTAAVDWEEDELPWGCQFDLITMIHVFEHMYHPEAAAQKAFNSLTSEGVLYVRLPNSDISGIERDYTEGHVAIHPSIYSTSSLLRIMQEVGFHPIWMEHQHGIGQSSFVFKKRAPKLSLFMITKNEQGNIGPCLDSVRSFCDEMIVLDTGSTDRTIAEAIEHGAVVHHSKKFDKNTTYEQFHFAYARNEAMSYCDPNADWLFWMDADDICEGHPNFSLEYDGYWTTIVFGNEHLKHARFFRNRWMPTFQGAIHETPDISGCRMGQMKTCRIHHKAGSKPGRVERNTTMLEAEHRRNPNDKRTLFYLANTYKDANRFQDAISVYQEYISLGGNFHDELVLAHFFIANCYYCLGDNKKAIYWSFQGLCLDDRYAEFYCRIGESYMAMQDYEKAINYFNLALSLPGPPPTVLWTHEHFYKEVPEKQLDICYEKKTRKQLQTIGKQQIIELVRPGALGDIIATTPALEIFREEYPNAWIRYICHPSAFEILQRNPDIDELAVEEGFCSIRRYFEYPMDKGYPDVPMEKHLAENFAESAGIQLGDNWQCKLILPGRSHGFDLPEEYITFAVKTGWSKFKEWPLSRWADLIARMKVQYPETKWIQLGGPNEPDVVEADLNLNGMTTLTQSFQILSGSKLFVGLDSVFNHACNALQVPAVIMFGSTHPQGSGYPEATNLVAELECQPCYIENEDISVHPKPPCPYNHKCMKQFMTVDRVLNAVNNKLNQSVLVE